MPEDKKTVLSDVKARVGNTQAPPPAAPPASGPTPHTTSNGGNSTEKPTGDRPAKGAQAPKSTTTKQG